ncbi:MAG TPA: FAD-binding oxidoreductase [Candidatus Saccharimonadales bacterium]|nr:FAD-binding oxidoreductase [Candidatus Saccharimonadales bacterium]
MSKVAHYLQEHLVGEVMAGTEARRYFATDASIFAVPPALVVYPRNENDVRKTARFTWQLAERGRVIAMTARGAGTDQTGAAIGDGIVIVFPAHMNRILELDTKNHTVSVEPGIMFGKLQQTLHTHGRFLPPYPASFEYSTVGGAIANNASGEKTSKYGDMRPFVRSLRVVLANGEVIETKRLAKRDLSRKLGLATFEGEIYRSVDALLEEQQAVIDSMQLGVSKNNAGYSLADVKRKDGTFDLTPLFVGSQGTLGVVTEAVLETEAHNPETTLMMATFESLEQTQNAVMELRNLPEAPSVLEMVDGNLLQQVHELNPNQLKDVITSPFPKTVLLVEFDSEDRQLKKLVKRASKIFEKYASSLQTATEPEQQQMLWKVRQASSAVLAHNEGLVRAVPVINDAAVPLTQLRAYLEGVYQLFESANLPVAVWGHVGDGNLHVQPRLNLGQVGDRQKAFRMLDDYFKLVQSLGGTLSAESGDGRLNAPYLETLYGSEVYTVLQKVKQIFDPYGTLNPGVKFGTSIDDLKAIIRNDYDLDHLHDHLPRS